MRRTPLKGGETPAYQVETPRGNGEPGSSGGLVISKPQNVAMINGKPHYSETKQFVFLGIYSGEYLWDEKVQNKDGSIDIQKHSYGLGNVWYSYLVPEIITSGKRITNS